MRRARWRTKRTVGRTTPTILPMRRARWRKRRTAKHTIRAIVLIGIALGAFVVLPPSVLRDIERVVGGHLDTFEETLGPAAERAADWLAEGEGVVRDAIGAAPSGATASGPARVIDGDTLDVRGTRIRLHGIDAPESAQTCLAGGQRWRCGRSATQALVKRIAGRPVACTERDRDRYGRVVAVCRVGDAGTRRPTSGRSVRRRLRDGDCGGGTSSPPGTGARVSASQPPPRPPGPGSVESRATSAGAGRASTTSPAGSSTRARASTPRRGSAGSARRRRPGRRGGGGRSGERCRASAKQVSLRLSARALKCPGLLIFARARRCSRMAGTRVVVALVRLVGKSSEREGPGSEGVLPLGRGNCSPLTAK